jgi:hypothetical protein
LRLRSGVTVHGTLLGADSRELRFLTEEGLVRNYQIGSVSSMAFTPSGDTTAKESTAASEIQSPRVRSSTGNITTNTTTEDFVVPGGTILTVRMIDAIDSDENEPGEIFHASLANDLIVDNNLLASRGADATVKLVQVEQAGKFRGREEVSMVLRDITINGKTYPVTTGFASVAGSSRGKQSAKVIGGSTAVGAIIGAIAGGGKGAAIGAASGAGAGAAIQVIRGSDVKVPSESQLDFTLAEPVRITRESGRK